MTWLRKFSLKNFCFTLAAIAFSIAITWKSEARYISPTEIYSTLTSDTIPLLKKVPVRNRPDSIVKDTTIKPDSLGRRIDTTEGASDTTLTQKVDTFNLRFSKDTLDAPVNYEAEDSAVLLVKDKKFLLYGKTKTTYRDVVLTAPRVVMNQETSIVTAYNSRDSLGNVITRAQFQQGTESFQSDTIEYNFKSRKGLTKNTYTRQNEMFVQGSLIKKVNDSTTFARRVIMTTCDYDEPHFGFVSSKGKFINNKLAITGPIHPEFEGVPIPIYLPFGLFPLNPGRHSGLIAPQFTVSDQLGIGLTNLGYYQVLNQYFDVRISTDIYSYGSWALRVAPTYRKRYKYNGGLNLMMQQTKVAFKGDPDYSLTKTFNISWSHSMDSKAKPNTNFSANVNAGSTRFNRYVTNDPYRNIQNNQSSSVNYSKNWGETIPMTLSLSANQSQNANLHLQQITLPDAGFSISTLFPFQRKEVVGAPKWYEKIGLGYSGVARNQIAFYDTAANLAKRIIDTLQWGAEHRIPITMTLPPLGKLLVTPTVSYSERWLTRRMRYRWNETAQKIDTVSDKKGFYSDREMTFGMGMNTTIFGTFNFKNSRLMAIRHVIRPTLSVNYKPNLSKGYYDVIYRTPTSLPEALPQLQSNLFQGFGYGKYGGLSFGVDNNLEMKVRSKKDSGEAAIKKVRLIDGFGFNSGYNFLAPNFKLQPFSLYLRSTLFEKVSLTAQGTLNPYKDTSGVLVDQYVWQDNRFSVGTLTNASVALSTRFQSKPRDPKQAASNTAAPVSNRYLNDPLLADDRARLEDYIRRNPAEFVDFNIPWSFDISYSLSYNRVYKYDEKRYAKELNSNISFSNSFSLTPKWIFTTNGYFDFDTKQLTQFTMSVSRDMHCWQMSISVVPINVYKYFNITISPKSTILQDLRVNRTRSFSSY